MQNDPCILMLMMMMMLLLRMTRGEVYSRLQRPGDYMRVVHCSHLPAAKYQDRAFLIVPCIKVVRKGPHIVEKWQFDILFLSRFHENGKSCKGLQQWCFSFCSQVWSPWSGWALLLWYFIRSWPRCAIPQIGTKEFVKTGADVKGEKIRRPRGV